MSTLHFKGTDIHTYGDLPQVGTDAPDFVLTKTDLSSIELSDFAGKPILISVYPSIDTSVCFESVKKFNNTIPDDKELVILGVSMDLPFALQRIKEGEAIDNMVLLSDYRNRSFGDDYNLTIADGPLAGLLARAIIVLDEHHKVAYTELVDEITTSVNYEAAFKSLT